jgi:esterase/lipase superfamily enzyme
MTAHAPAARHGTMPPRAIASLLALLLLGSGCSSTWKMMPTPVAYREGRVDPFADIAPHNQTTTVQILYATDRKRSTSTNKQTPYGAKRDTALNLGVATVQIGSKDATWEQVERASRTKKRPPMRIVETEQFGPLWTTISAAQPEARAEAVASTSPDDPIREPARRFVDEVNARLASAGTNDIVVYVHGFNTPFAAPIHMMAQFEHYMAHDVVCIAYSWPSRATPIGYSTQLFKAGTTIRKLRELLILLAEHTDVDRIHLVSYSAGAPILAETLLQLRLIHADTPPDEIRERTRIGTVVFAGADEDVEYIRGLALDKVGEIFDSVTIYMSRTDAAMVLSRTFTTGTARLGRALNELNEAELEAVRAQDKLQVVDVTRAVNIAGGGDIWSHAYWYLNPWVSTDVIAQFRYRLPPEERALQREQDQAVWEFPKDYPEQIVETLDRQSD